MFFVSFSICRSLRANDGIYVELQKKKKKKKRGKKEGRRYFVEDQKERKIEESQEVFF
jgi:hypothetical protein